MKRKFDEMTSPNQRAMLVSVDPQHSEIHKIQKAHQSHQHNSTITDFWNDANLKIQSELGHGYIQDN